MMEETDALVGMRFEVGGGLSRMSGRVLGKAGALYLVQKTDADYCELLQLDDLRSAKFYPEPVASAVPPAPAEPATEVEMPAMESGAASASPGRRSLAEHFKRNLAR